MPGPTRWSAEPVGGLNPRSAAARFRAERGASRVGAMAVKVVVIVAAAVGVGFLDRAIRPIPAKARTTTFEVVTPPHGGEAPTADGGTGDAGHATAVNPVPAPGVAVEPPVSTHSGAEATPPAGATVALRPIPPDEFNQLIAQTGIVEVSVDQVKALLDNQYGRIIDGRQAYERAEGWVPGAIHLTRTMLATDEGLKIAEELAKENEGFPLIVYCGGPDCDESHHLAQLLIARFPAVFVMKEGMGGWLARGLEVEK